jgi:serine phosphatase RsbU (regulator of sigma subunit)
MPGPSLRALLGPRSAGLPAVKALLEATGDGICVVDAAGKVLLGKDSAADSNGAARVPVQLEDATLGFVTGPTAPATALALLLTHLAARESEGRALASEVLHLYREIHLIEHLSEQLAALLNVATVGQSALAQAQRLIHATHGGILVMEKEGGPLSSAASFRAPSGDAASEPNGEVIGENGPLSPASGFAASILERGVAEIINHCADDPRALDSERSLGALMCAPLRAGQRTVGLIALANSTAGATYSAADLKLLNTIALQTAAAIANSLLCAEMVEAARARAAYAAELHAASTVQQLLLQSASRPTPGFHVESVYLPASEVGGDFFFVSSAPDGSLTAIVGDVSGKGLTAAMRVAMILGALRRETSYHPADILHGLNNTLIAQGQLGFTTACCIRISLSGDYTLANAGHIAPYIAGRELDTPPALPLGLVPEQTYPLIHGRLARGERLVLMSDGVPEARSATGDLYGFERLSSLTLRPAQEIAETAQQFGQEDDITVMTLALDRS